MEKLNYLFVYGTLKKDQTASWSNALGDEKFIGYGRIKGFDMYKIMNSYPGIKKGAGEVLGELYEITNQDTWKKVEELTTKFKLYILERDNDCMEEIIQNNELLNKHRQAFIKAKDSIKSNLSSTFVREKIKNGKSIRYLTPDEVIIYIKEHQLYQ